jgi:phosphate-selective porin OprO and OprP
MQSQWARTAIVTMLACVQTLFATLVSGNDRETAQPSPADSSVIDERIQLLEEQVQGLRSSLLSGKSSALLPKEEERFPDIQLNGMLQIDGGWIEQDARNESLLGDIDNSLGFRRTRIGTDGLITEQLYYRLVLDFALAGRPSFRDAYVEYRDIDGLGTIRLGESRQPFGMDAQTPARDLLFLERSLVNALSPFRQVGLGLRNHNDGETLTWHAAVFGYPTDNFGDAINDSGFGSAARVTALPWVSDDGLSLIHIGAGHAFLHPGEQGLRFRSSPEYGGLLTGTGGSNPVVPPFVDTGVLVGAQSNQFNVEGALIHGALTVQAEAVAAVSRLDSGAQATLTGAYVQSVLVLTGEVHKYDREFGAVKRLTPDRPVFAGGPGAWELAARVSTLDLNDSSVAGGRLTDLTFGINWYLNDHSRLQFNAIKAYLDRDPVGNNQASIYAARMSVDF